MLSTENLSTGQTHAELITGPPAINQQEQCIPAGSTLRAEGTGLRTWEYAKGWGWGWVSGPGSTLRAGGGNGSQGLGVR